MAMPLAFRQIIYELKAEIYCRNARAPTDIAILNQLYKYVGVVPPCLPSVKAGQPRGVCPYKNYTNDLGLLYIAFLRKMRYDRELVIGN